MKSGILLMVRELHHGGSERQMTETALGLDRARFEPHVGAFHVQGNRADELRVAGVPILSLPVRSFKSPTSAKVAWELVRYIRAHNIRLVHTFDWPLTVWAIPAVRYLTKAVALGSQRCHLDLIPAGMRKALLFAERRADGVVVNCRFLEHHLIEDAEIPASRVHLCYNGIDIERFSGADSPRPAALPLDALVIGVVCVLRPEKGLLTLLDAFAKVREQNPKLTLAIVGSGPMLPELQQRARDLNIIDACVFEPTTSRVADWMKHIDIFVLPSHSEALSNSLMEAMACDCCAVASRVGGNPELVEDGVRGFLFPAGDAPALSAVLQKAIGDPVLRRRVADTGQVFIRNGFSRERAALRMGEIYSQLIEKKD